MNEEEKREAQEGLVKALKAHELWLDSDGKDGLQLDLSGRRLAKALFENADVSKASFKGTPLSTALWVSNSFDSVPPKARALHRLTRGDNDLSASI